MRVGALREEVDDRLAVAAWVGARQFIFMWDAAVGHDAGIRSADQIFYDTSMLSLSRDN